MIRFNHIKVNEHINKVNQKIQTEQSWIFSFEKSVFEFKKYLDGITNILDTAEENAKELEERTIGSI